MNRQRAHWYVGTLTLLAFLLSGAYMRWIIHVPALSDIERSLYRSRHLFILLSALANLALAKSSTDRLSTHTWANRRDRFVSISVLITPPLLLIAFLTEPEQPFAAPHGWSHAALYLLFAAAALLVVPTRPRN
jgi:hypothetical protein